MATAGIKIRTFFNDFGKVKHENILRIFLALRGIAICLVVLAHTAISLLSSQLNLLPETTSILSLYDFWQIPSPGKFITLELCRCAVPLFLFFAGFHLARFPQSGRGSWNNIKSLLVPMIFWSLAAWVISWRKGSGWDVPEFLRLFFTGKAQLGYFFIILIIQYYIIANWLASAIKLKPKLVLAGAFIMQLLVHVFDYIYLLDSLKIIESFQWTASTGPFPEFLFPRFIFSLTLGLWASIYVNDFKNILKKYFIPIIVIGIFAAASMLLETGSIFHRFYNTFHVSMFDAASKAWAEWKITTAFWTLAAVFLIIGFSQRFLPFKKGLELCGKNSFQILLLHGMVLYILKLVEYKFLVNHIWFGVTGFIITFFLTLGIPLAFTKLVQRWCPGKVKYLLIGS
ncbi:MAG TPA: acyltransferase family protein [Spirochaetota bacterium]|nr:acyltransferase family protein [Spirochaetota bacterium]HPL17666.1 acyltransferase family protein [Spirochaetota bacterium]HQF07702.1 acyltransferase family protein [Spirochaetota bacterium]HQH99291.1 acyltransferase family protein [Spirochaetota bacterium]HQJ72931.1 acyltransferase family protein [Spirochaetota bacterium]